MMHLRREIDRTLTQIERLARMRKGQPFQPWRTRRFFDPKGRESATPFLCWCGVYLFIPELVAPPSDAGGANLRHCVLPVLNPGYSQQ